MKTFALDIIPKIQIFSKKLDDVTLLTNQHWVVFSTIATTKSVYIFRRNNELLLSTNGNVTKGKWEYLGNNSILIDIENQSYLYKHGFIDSDVLALKTDNNNDYAVLLNENKFDGELNSINDITKFLENKYLLHKRSVNAGSGSYNESTYKSNEEIDNSNNKKSEIYWTVLGLRIYERQMIFLVLGLTGFISIIFMLFSAMK